MRTLATAAVLLSAFTGCDVGSDVQFDFDSTSIASLDGGGTQFGATINGVMWYWNVSYADVKATPDWQRGEEPPVSMADAIRLAEAQLTKYTDTPTAYQLDAVELKPINNNCCNSPARRWVYVVHYERTERFENGSRGTILLPVLMDGRVIEGVKQTPKPAAAR